MTISFYVPSSLTFWDTFTGDDFTGDNGDPLNQVAWSDPYPGGSTSVFAVEIDTNRAAFSFTSVTNGGVDRITVDGKFKLAGDFDVEIEFSELVTANNEAAGYEMVLTSDSGYYALVKAHYNVGNKFFIRYNDGSSHDTTVSRTNSYGKYRITRVGPTFYCFTKDGGAASWTSRGSLLLDTGDVGFALRGFDWDNGSEISIKFDNFIINSGTVIPPA